MNRNIRLGQLLSPFGIGQLVNFPNDETLMICGLDAWDEIIEQRIQNAGFDHIERDEFVIREPRLEQLLGVNQFRKPFPFRENSKKNSRLTIPGVRFPQWHYCMKCSVMRQIELNRQENPRCSSGECRGRLIPVRFVAVCPQGHIQDVPFLDWVHPDGLDDERHVLSYSGGKGSGDLSSIIIQCSCGQRRTLGGIMNEGALDGISTCSGHRPWLGPIGIRQPQPCEHSLRVLIKGSSNVHYAMIKSALYLPQVGDTTSELVQRIIEREEEALCSFYELDNDGRVLRVYLQTLPEVKLGRITVDALLEQVIGFMESGKDNVDQEINSDFDIRIQEYQYLNVGRDSENTDFKAVINQFSSTEEGEFLSEYFDHITLIEKLRETRVFAGFSRLSSEDGKLSKDRIKDLSIVDKDWLPAHVVYGEGIFIKFSDEKLDEWSSQSNSNLHDLIGRYHTEQARRMNDYQNRDITPSFILLHTFSHLLINRLCYNCGYGSSSLRERIYFSSSADQRMNGILIYTSSGDSEGSMGGLVRQGRELNFYRLVKEIIEDARWCSADPVCMDVGSSTGQGPDSLNGAACHNCAIVPETSCEEFNKLLDRSALIGTNNENNLGFFESDMV
ncbi:DUF1998 domain-containing protein [Flagellimonas sediminis]|uniref:DUF1998 domain-containing protein n=1 Tax=Flagellimonas sediminis TaxID=2696468 RepID=A0A6I5KXJ9_9FLAO|nr:DUF1998 domain-containing protein [Allomuricauda sediminis]NDV43082.1 DUF1998 domain-containing protein [Allomuricauda sediminis]